MIGRILFAWFFLIVGQLAFVGASDATFERARLWFERLSEPERRLLQTDLIFAGYFQLEDCVKELTQARLGRFTFDALTRFEDHVGSQQPGYLRRVDRLLLAQQARQFALEAGFAPQTFRKAGLSVPFPANLFDLIDDDGYSVFASRDNTLRFEPIGLEDRNYSFYRLYQDLTKSNLYGTADYVKLRENQFVFIGRNEATGLKYFAYFRRNRRYNSGFILSWEPARESDATALSLYMAANLKLLPIGAD